jgi:hypothetical protein
VLYLSTHKTLPLLSETTHLFQTVIRQYKEVAYSKVTLANTEFHIWHVPGLLTLWHQNFLLNFSTFCI